MEQKNQMQRKNKIKRKNYSLSSTPGVTNVGVVSPFAINAVVITNIVKAIINVAVNS